jgi:hypothetical protein
MFGKECENGVGIIPTGDIYSHFPVNYMHCPLEFNYAQYNTVSVYNSVYRNSCEQEQGKLSPQIPVMNRHVESMAIYSEQQPQRQKEHRIGYARWMPEVVRPGPCMQSPVGNPVGLSLNTMDDFETLAARRARDACEGITSSVGPFPLLF